MWRSARRAGRPAAASDDGFSQSINAPPPRGVGTIKMSSSAWLLGLLLLLLACRLGEAQDEEEWDLRALYPRCAAWRPYDQGACASCCAHAIAAALSARACIQDATDLRLSAAQIWDCAGTGGEATCAGGSSLFGMVYTLGAGDASAVALLPEAACANATPPARDPNATTCYARFAHCAPAPTPYVLRSALFMDFVLFGAAPPPAQTDAQAALLMTEIRRNGPVVSVLTLRGDDIAAFFALRAADAVFDPRSTAWQPVKRHCLAVYGWGVSAAGVPFWRVQNSLGDAWGDAGVGRIARGRGALELQWRAPTLESRACGSACLSGYGNYSQRTAPAPATPAPPLVLVSPAPPTWGTGVVVGLALCLSMLLVVAFGGFFWASTAPTLPRYRTL